MGENRDLFEEELNDSLQDREPKDQDVSEIISEYQKKAHKRKLAAARQAKYRESKRKSATAAKVLHTYISYDAAYHMTCLCDHYSMTQRELLEKLLGDAHKSIAERLHEEDYDKYLYYIDAVLRAQSK